MKKSKLVPFEFLPEKEAMRRTPYQTVRTESFTVSPREK